MRYNRILIINLKQAGDVLVSSPVIAAVHEAWPGAEVSMLVARGTEDMVRGHPGLRRVYTLNRRQKSWRETLKLVRELRRRSFDLTLDLSWGDRGAFLALASGAGERVGFARRRQPFWQRWGTFTRLVSAPMGMHMVEQNLEALRALGVNPDHPRLSFYWDKKAARRVQELLAEMSLGGRPYAVVHPGAGWRFKCWTPAGYARVIEALEEERGLPVVLTGAPGPLDRELAEDILAQCRVRPRVLVGETSLMELGVLIAWARLFFGVDSAPMHLAAAVNTPATALFGPSGDINWGPWGEGHRVIKKGWDCQPCGRAGCEDTKISRCLTELSPAEVLADLAGWPD